MTAPVCPISVDQVPYYHTLFRGNGGQPTPPIFPSIPLANDLPSLIRTVNVMRDVLRQLSTSLTINNTYMPKPPFAKAQGDTNYSEFPRWDQKEISTALGFVYHREKGGLDKKQRAHVQRTNAVAFQNNSQDDKDFIWSYEKPLDSYGIEPLFPTASFDGS